MKKLFHCGWLLCIVHLAAAQTPLSGIINQYASIADINYCASELTVSAPENFAVGTDILILQMQGATINESNNSTFGNVEDLGGAGLFERARIQAINGNVLTLENALVNTYDLNGAVQIVDIPTYENAEVTATLEPANWDGTTGGVLALEVTGTLTLSAPISADGKGFRGGVAEITESNNCNAFIGADDYFYNQNNWRGAAKGEGIARATSGREAGRGAQANGGGGGNDHNSGGGGGAHLAAAGNGGINDEPRFLGCDGNFPGIGGKAIPSAGNRIFLGGGGGAGHENNDVSTDGGAGGGIIFIKAQTIIGNTQSISARGENVTEATGGDGAGGGGGGGTILLDAAAISSTLTINADGGAGGDIDNNNQDRCHGPGGGGSGGRVLTAVQENTTISVFGGAAGLGFNSTACPEGTNGAQPGNDGTIEAFPGVPMGEMPSLVPVPAFEFSLDDLTVQFNNNSTNADAYRWDFGDGNASTNANPIHTYAMAGMYDVRLSAINDCDSIATTQTLNLQQIAAPTADFTADTTSGCAPLAVHFSNLSSPDAANFIWIFPGGTPLMSNDENPTITYETPGTFNVILIASNATGADTTAFPNYITVSAPPTSDFDFTINERTVNFTGNATDFDRLRWDFGDGATSPVANPAHTYADDGDYEVTLSAINTCDSVSFTQTVSIRTSPTAAFAANATEGCPPFVVDFVNNSSDNATGFTWLLEGAEPMMSNAENPSVTYAAPGTYDVTLIANNGVGADTLRLEDFITVLAAPRADYFFTRDGFTFNFTDNSRHADRLLWSFGDGNTSTEQNPSHTYAGDGTYDVTLSAINACDSVSFKQTISLDTRPNALFSVGVREGCAPFVVRFQNATDNADSFAWLLPGAAPSTSSERNPRVTYNTAGTFDATLIASNESGADTLTFEDYITVGAGPVAGFTFQKDDLSFIFTNNSRNSDRFAWNFGDGNASNSADPTHTYDLPGNYTVTLTATNDCGSATQTTRVTAGVPPAANFTVDRQGGCVPHLVNFSDVTRGIYDTRTWEFPGGDPVLSDAERPTVRYDEPGLYDVILVVDGALGRDSIVKEDYIEVLAPPTAAFEVTTNGNTVTFNSSSTNAASLLWNFGDGNTGTGQSTTHTYATGGVYNVTLNASNAFCSRSVTEVVSVGSTSVEELRALGINIFPNPVKDALFIQTDTNFQELAYGVFSLTGQPLAAGVFTKSQTIDLAAYANGAYLLQLKQKDQVWMVKIVKQ